MMKKPNISTFLKFYRPAIISSALVLGITFYLFFETNKQLQEKNKALFELQAVALTDAIKSRMMDYIQILKGVQSFIIVSDTITRDEWKGYVGGVNVKEHYPGVQGIGFSIFVPDSSKDDFEARVQQEGFPEFAIWPNNPRELYSAILFLEPFDSTNKRAFGYDMYTDSARNKAMKKAMDTGRPAISSGIILVQEIIDEVQKGLNLYLPIYKKNADTTTVESRRRNIVGFAYSPFRVHDLMAGTLGNDFNNFNIQIYDEGKKGDGGLLFSSSIDNENGDSNGLFRTYQKDISIEVAEHVWDIHVSAIPEFGYDREVPFYLLGGGLVISFLVFLTVISFGYIRKSTYLKQAIADNAVAAIFIVNKYGFCTFMNPAAKRLTGYSFEEIMLEPFWPLLFQHNDHEQFSMSEETSMQDLLIYHKSGKAIYINLNAKPIYEYASKKSLLIQITDITQEIEAESSLRQKNKMLQALNQVGINLSVELDLKRLLHQIIDICTEITDSEFGVFFYQVDDHNETLVLHATSAINSPYVESVIDTWPKYTILDVLRIDDVSRISNQVLMPKGMAIDNRPIRSFLAVPVKSRNGVVIGTLCFGHTKVGMFQEHEVEITKGIAAQAAIALDNSQLFETISNKNEELIKINNDLDNFVYTASHDLKAPVLNIEGLVYVLTKALKEGKMEKAETMIEMIQTSILKFKETIQALTEVAKTNKNIDDEVVKVDLKQLFEDIKLSIDDMVESASADISADFSKLGEEEVCFSLANIRSLLINLMTNAIKYRSPDRKPIIRLSFEKDNKLLIIKISDNGLGIAKEHQERVFQMFKRMHTQVEGTGIGLYLVKRIVENQGGTITIDSEVNQGTTFTLYLPMT